jgi:hypothetical protein
MMEVIRCSETSVLATATLRHTPENGIRLTNYEVSSQSPVVALRHEVHYWVVWLYTQARTVSRAVVTDFLFNCWCLKIPSDNRIGHVPGCACNRAQNFRLEAF